MTKIPERDFIAFIESKYRLHSGTEAAANLAYRYAYAINQIQMPDIDADELEIIRCCIRDTQFDINKDPIEFLQESLLSVSCEIRSNYYTDESLKAFAGEPYDPGEPQNVKQYDDLVEKIAGWTPLQALKILEAIE